jgi:hypothetical protein
MSMNVTLEHGMCEDDAMQPSCAQWTSNPALQSWTDACEERIYDFHATTDPCGPCEPRLFVYKTCSTAATEDEWLASLLYSVAGAELTFTIFSALAEVLRQFKMREIAVRYLLELTPHQGTRSRNQQDTFGLLPKFNLDRMGNIVAWNRMRIVVQTWDSTSFEQGQKRAAYVLLVAFGLIAAQVYTFWIASSDWEAPQIIEKVSKLLPRRFSYDDQIDSPALNSMSIKAMLLQLLGSGLTLLIVWTGGKATRLFEYELPHMLLLKKAELQVSGIPTVRSLVYSTEVELEIWCNVAKKTSLRDHLIENKLHEIVARVAVRHSVFSRPCTLRACFG